MFSNWWCKDYNYQQCSVIGDAMQCNGGATSFTSQVHWSHPVHQTRPTIRFSSSRCICIVCICILFCNRICIWAYHLKARPPIRTRKSFLHLILPQPDTCPSKKFSHLLIFLPTGLEIPCLLPKACSPANKTRPRWSRMGVGRHWNCFPWKLRN